MMIISYMIYGMYYTYMWGVWGVLGWVKVWWWWVCTDEGPWSRNMCPPNISHRWWEGAYTSTPKPPPPEMQLAAWWGGGFGVVCGCVVLAFAHVPMGVQMCTPMSTCTCGHVYVHMDVRTCLHVCADMHTYTCVYMWECMYVHTDTCMGTCMCMLACTCKCPCMWMCTRTCTCKVEYSAVVCTRGILRYFDIEIKVFWVSETNL